MWGGKQLAKLGGESSAALSFTSTADIWYIAVPFRCTPIRAGVTITTAITVTAAIINFDSITYTATGSNTRGDCDVGQVTLPVSAYAYKNYYDETDFASYSGASPTWKGTLNEGDVIAVQVYQAATAGAGFPFVIVEVNPEQPANNSNMVESA